MIQVSVTEIELFLQGDTVAGRGWIEKTKSGPVQMWGHEFCGEVIEVGDRVHNLKVGDRTFWGQNLPCGRCPACIAGHTSICRKGPVPGIFIPGALAEYALMPAGLLVKVPESVTDSEVTAMQPLHGSVCFVVGADVQPGDVVAVLGQGVMGLSISQLLGCWGASRILGVDVRAEMLTLSKQMGTDVVINASEVDPVQAILEATGGIGADIVFECAGGNTAFGLSGTTTLSVASRAVRDGGKVDVVSHYKEGTGLELGPLKKGVQFRGISHCSRKQIDWAVELVASKQVQVTPLITHVLEGIDKVPQAIEMTANKRKYGVLNPVQVKFG
jgi:threonine dehydrogenase-like Zn-dependent dehydrogenase